MRKSYEQYKTSGVSISVMRPQGCPGSNPGFGTKPTFG